MSKTDNKMNSVIQFYHLLSTPLDVALPKLLDKALQLKMNVLIKVSDGNESTKINNLLWTFAADKFIPHGNKQDKHPQRQPIYISEDYENLNQAGLYIIIDGSEVTEEQIKNHRKIFYIFDGNNNNAMQAARKHWKAYKDKGRELQYIKQKENGGWEYINL